MAHRKLKSSRKNCPGGALQLRLRQYSERPSGLVLFLSCLVTHHTCGWYLEEIWNNVLSMQSYHLIDELMVQKLHIFEWAVVRQQVGCQNWDFFPRRVHFVRPIFVNLKPNRVEVIFQEVIWVFPSMAFFANVALVSRLCFFWFSETPLLTWLSIYLAADHQQVETLLRIYQSQAFSCSNH